MRLIILFFLLFFTPLKSFAGGLYFDLGTGYSRVGGAHRLFNESAPETNFSISGKVGLFWNLTPDVSTIQFHVGFYQNFISQSYSGGQYNFFSTLPLARLEIYRFFGGIGYSQWVWAKKSGAGFSFGNAFKTDLTSLNIHLGMLWKTTPNLHLAFQVERDMLHNTNTSLSFLQFSLQIRFYLFDIVTKKKKNGMKLDGWRYPFGIESRR